MDGPLGVGARFGCFRKGDSGRGNEGLEVDLSTGLGGRAPGPTDCENLGSEGVGVLLLKGWWPLRLKSPKEGVVGVGGKLSAERVGEARFDARWSGRKMPEPGTEVVK